MYKLCLAKYDGRLIFLSGGGGGGEKGEMRLGPG